MAVRVRGVKDHGRRRAAGAAGAKEGQRRGGKASKIMDGGVVEEGRRLAFFWRWVVILSPEVINNPVLNSGLSSCVTT
jgi:hypothetical protein